MPDSTPRQHAFATRQLHGGTRVPDAHAARRTPVHLTAGFVFDDFDDARDRFAGGPGYSYTRIGNPTTTSVERRIAELEGGLDAVLVSSGQAAIAIALLGLLRSGDEVVASAHIYEGTRCFLEQNLAELGIAVRFVHEPERTGAWSEAITPRTRALFAESIPNPRGRLVDLAAIAAIGHEHGAPLVVDSTFASPYLLRPLEHGADVVVHSASKLLAGHGGVLGGVIVGGAGFDWDDAERFPQLAGADATLGGRSWAELHGPGAYLARLRAHVAPRWGSTPSPLHASLIEQGIETLSLRVERASANALTVASWLAGRAEVESVDYSGLPEHPSHELARYYLPDGQGPVLAFTLRGGKDAARAVIERVRVFTHMTHIGDVRSLVLHPATTTHIHRSAAERAAAGIGDGLLRLSVGIEDVHDLIADLEDAFAAIPASARTLEEAR